MIDPKLLDLLVCPLTKSKLIYNESTKELSS
ncbi:MAG: Trm112 family protein, partial [Gammaproteobacteria bacterium]|nr:Trm112 family protein [Gammaproteobacteria bacterium]